METSTWTCATAADQPLGRSGKSRSPALEQHSPSLIDYPWNVGLPGNACSRRATAQARARVGSDEKWSVEVALPSTATVLVAGAASLTSRRLTTRGRRIETHWPPVIFKPTRLTRPTTDRSRAVDRPAAIVVRSPTEAPPVVNRPLSRNSGQPVEMTEPASGALQITRHTRT